MKQSVPLNKTVFTRTCTVAAPERCNLIPQLTWKLIRVSWISEKDHKTTIYYSGPVYGNHASFFTINPTTGMLCRESFFFYDRNVALNKRTRDIQVRYTS